MATWIDGHLDLAMNALSYGRDLLQEVAFLRGREPAELAPARGIATVSLPEMRRGGVAACAATLFARTKPGMPAGLATEKTLFDWPSQTMTHAAAAGQLAYYRVLEQLGAVKILTNRREMQALAKVRGLTAGGHGVGALAEADVPLGIVVLMEGADPIVQPPEVKLWWDRGVRMVGLAHFGPSAYAQGTPSRSAPVEEREGGLTSKGRELLAEMAKLGMGLDLTHLTDRSLFEAMDLYGGPVCATHSNCRSLAAGYRQITDEQVRRIAQRGGVIGVALHNAMLISATGNGPGGEWEAPREAVSLEQAAMHVDQICQLAGSARHAAMGTDLDGGFGCERAPRDVQTIADVPRIGEWLEKRGYKGADIEGILWGNWWGFWERVMPE